MGSWHQELPLRTNHKGCTWAARLASPPDNWQSYRVRMDRYPAKRAASHTIEQWQFAATQRGLGKAAHACAWIKLGRKPQRPLSLRLGSPR